MAASLNGWSTCDGSLNHWAIIVGSALTTGLLVAPVLTAGLPVAASLTAGALVMPVLTTRPLVLPVLNGQYHEIFSHFFCLKNSNELVKMVSRTFSFLRKYSIANLENHMKKSVCPHTC